MCAKRKTPDYSKDRPITLTGQPFYGFELDDLQLAYANAIWSPEIDSVFCNSKAGGGKTLIATGVANMLVQYGDYNEIIYIMAPYGERTLGYRPGSVTEKSSVYFEPFYQALVKCNVNPMTAINSESMVNQKNGTGYITCITDTFLRGSTLDDAIVIIDESQNATVAQLKKILTRVGKHTKVIVIGHDSQCDLDQPEASGFTKYIEHFRGHERTAVCQLKTNYRSWISEFADTF